MHAKRKQYGSEKALNIKWNIITMCYKCAWIFFFVTQLVRAGVPVGVQWTENVWNIEVDGAKQL